MNSKMTWIVCLVLGTLGAVVLLSVNVTRSSGGIIEPIRARQDPSAAYGAQLVVLCTPCHGADLTGDTSPNPQSPRAPSLTRGGVLDGWTETDFLTAMLLGYRPDGQPISPYMPWKIVTFDGGLQNRLHPLWLYLRSLPPATATPDKRVYDWPTTM